MIQATVVANSRSSLNPLFREEREPIRMNSTASQMGRIGISVPRKVGLDGHQKKPIQFAAFLGVCIPPLVLSSITVVSYASVFIVEIFSKQVVPIVLLAIALVLFGRYKIQSLARTPASYERAMRKNTLRLPTMATILSILVCVWLDPVLHRLWGSRSVSMSWSTLLLLVHLVLAMAIIGGVVVLRFVHYGFYRASFYRHPEGQLRFWKSKEATVIPVGHSEVTMHPATTSQSEIRLPIQKKLSYSFTVPIMVWLHLSFAIVGALLCAFTLREITERFFSLSIPWGHSLVACLPPLVVDTIHAFADQEIEPADSLRTALLRQQVGRRVLFTFGIIALSLCFVGDTGLSVSLFLIGVGVVLSLYTSLLDGANRYFLFAGTRSFPETIADDAITYLQMLMRDPLIARQILESKPPDRISVSPDLKQMGTYAAAEMSQILNQPYARGLEDDVFWWGNLNCVLAAIEGQSSHQERVSLVRGLCVVVWSHSLALQQCPRQDMPLSLTTLAAYKLILLAFSSLFGGENANELTFVSLSILKALHVIHQGFSDFTSSRSDTFASPWQEIIPLCNNVSQLILERIQPHVCVEHFLDNECVHWLHKHLRPEPNNLIVQQLPH